MADLGTNYGEHFGRNSLKHFFSMSISSKITNDKWEGEVKGGKGDRVNILTYGLNAWEDYDGTDITFNDVQEVEGQLVLSEQRSNAFRILSWDRFKTYAMDVDSTESSNVGELMKQEVDAFNLALYGDAAAGNWVGTDYTTGTVTVTVTTGEVTGSSTVFTAAMEGRPFKALGHTQWYRVKAGSYASATSIYIEDDKDDVASAYTGGAIGAGATYTIQAATKLQVSASNIDAKILALKEALDQKGADSTYVPKKDRWLVVPSKIESILLQSDMLTPYTPSAYEDVVKLGIIGMYRGFKVFSSEEVAGNNTTGFYVLAGHPSAITHAFVQIESKVVQDLEANFGKGYKQLVAYGSKVLDARRKALAVGFWYV